MRTNFLNFFLLIYSSCNVVFLYCAIHPYCAFATFLTEGNLNTFYWVVVPVAHGQSFLFDFFSICPAGVTVGLLHIMKGERFSLFVL